MGGGAHRGPVAPPRQRRTIRFVQLLLVVIAAGLFAFAGYSFGRISGYSDGKRAGEVGPPPRPGASETIVLGALGAGALVTAWLLQKDGIVRVPTPAKLDELAGRAEQAAIERAEEIADSSKEAGSV